MRVILLTPGQRQELESIVRCGTSQYRAVVRARLVLLRADGVPVSRFALTDRTWFGETDRDLGVIGVGELSMCGVTGLVRPT